MATAKHGAIHLVFHVIHTGHDRKKMASPGDLQDVRTTFWVAGTKHNRLSIAQTMRLGTFRATKLGWTSFEIGFNRITFRSPLCSRNGTPFPRQPKGV